jgi:hypothetical protein
MLSGEARATRRGEGPLLRRRALSEWRGDPNLAHWPDAQSGEEAPARGQRFAAPQRRRRALVERSGDWPARGPARKGQAEHEDLPLKGSV